MTNYICANSIEFRFDIRPQNKLEVISERQQIAER